MSTLSSSACPSNCNIWILGHLVFFAKMSWMYVHMIRRDYLCGRLLYKFCLFILFEFFFLGGCIWYGEVTNSLSVSSSSWASSLCDVSSVYDTFDIIVRGTTVSFKNFKWVAHGQFRYFLAYPVNLFKYLIYFLYESRKFFHLCFTVSPID